MRRRLRELQQGEAFQLRVLLYCTEGWTPTEISEELDCSRSTVYRVTDSYRAGKLVYSGAKLPPAAPSAGQSRLAAWLDKLMAAAPAQYECYRSRWSCLLLAVALEVYAHLIVSDETVRRHLHESGYVWKRAKLCARDDDPERTSKLARIRQAFEERQGDEAFYFADEMDIELLPKVGYQWQRKGEQAQVMTPGQNQKQYLAGAVGTSGERLAVVGEKKNSQLFIDLLEEIEARTPKRVRRIYLVVDNFKIHKSRQTERWLAQRPRLKLLWQPRYCPQANPIERVFGEVHNNCTRNHEHQELAGLVEEVEAYFSESQGWRGTLPSLYYGEAVTQAMAELVHQPSLSTAA
jgi:transposase